MKETVKTSRTAGYLEKIFRALNAKYFNGELEEPIITIQSITEYSDTLVARIIERIKVISAVRIKIEFIGGYTVTVPLQS